LLVLLCTFALFPLLGLLLKPVLTPLVTPDLYLGILFLCMLPSTVQSSIAFTAAARGNVPAAICSASASNLFGIFITPVLVGLLTSAQMSGGSPLESACRSPCSCCCRSLPARWRGAGSVRGWRSTSR
jgi:sodium/bile acid cotransporter 7